jgi:hypothetical protein
VLLEFIVVLVVDVFTGAEEFVGVVGVWQAVIAKPIARTEVVNFQFITESPSYI